MLTSNSAVSPEHPCAPDFAIAGFVFDAASVCRFATAKARSLVGVPEPVGLGATSVFANWFTQPDFDREASVVHHGDGRLFRCETRRVSEGITHLVLTDISPHILESARAAHDGLTGLAQRDALKAWLGRLLPEPRPGSGVAVHHLDLDRMKTVNETLGHAVGDRLLIKVAERLRTLLPPDGILARLGGDEFVLVQPGVSETAQAERLADRIVDLIGRAYVAEGHMLNIGASVGVALSDHDASDPETLLRYADLALYRAKAEGRGTVRFFEPHMDARTQARRLLETDLRLALAMRQFRLNFQPLFNLEANKVTGFEALLRWTHPVRGPVPPAEFIPLAEEVGVIGQIGEWVLHTACREAAGWPRDVSIAVNISPHQFRGGRLIDTVVEALAAANLPAHRLELEITEGALLDDTSLVLKTLHALRDMGVRISMDDFGTGYSSLSYLRKFPFDKIKIDQSFVRGLGVDDECDAILRAVSTLGATLGMRTTAEGVETAEQMSRVRREGCTEVQGYFTGRPLSASDARALLSEKQGNQQ